MLASSFCRTLLTPASRRLFASSAAAAAELRKTPLWDLHVARDAHMTEFGGWDMVRVYHRISAVVGVVVVMCWLSCFC
jgi:hypothetical protein